jgi:hypothetical protein
MTLVAAFIVGFRFLRVSGKSGKRNRGLRGAVGLPATD